MKESSFASVYFFQRVFTLNVQLYKYSLHNAHSNDPYARMYEVKVVKKRRK